MTEETSAVLEAIEGVRAVYQPFGWPTDTLVTKVLLGTLGCIPACDRYFLSGFKHAGYQYSTPNDKFIDRVFAFCRKNVAGLQREQGEIERRSGVRYPLMKLVDMYFHQIGLELG